MPMSQGLSLVPRAAEAEPKGPDALAPAAAGLLSGWQAAPAMATSISNVAVRRVSELTWLA
jgi:hypothetical protein